MNKNSNVFGKYSNLIYNFKLKNAVGILLCIYIFTIYYMFINAKIDRENKKILRKKESPGIIVDRTNYSS